jgi:hypothetical protein
MSALTVVILDFGMGSALTVGRAACRAYDMAFAVWSWSGLMEWFHLLPFDGWRIKMLRLSCLIGTAPSLPRQGQSALPMLAFDARKLLPNNPESPYGSRAS